MNKQGPAPLAPVLIPPPLTDGRPHTAVTPASRPLPDSQQGYPPLQAQVLLAHKCAHSSSALKKLLPDSIPFFSYSLFSLLQPFQEVFPRVCFLTSSQSTATGLPPP